MELTRRGLPPLFICAAVNGGVQGKEYNSSLPESVAEIVAEVEAAVTAGAAMVHVHARNPNDLTKGARHARDWVELVEAIRSRCPDVIVNATTGGDLEMTMEERLSCLDAQPDIASLNLTPDMSRFRLKRREAPLPFPRDPHEIDVCLPFTYGQIEHFASEMALRGIKPELETYHTGGAWVIRNLIDKGFIRPPYLIQTVMGVQTASYPTPRHLLHLLDDLPQETVWLCSGIGPFQLPMTSIAMLMGGHVRVGLEDNIYYRRGEKLRGNAQAVERVVRLAEEFGREVMTPGEARAHLGLADSPLQRLHDREGLKDTVSRPGLATTLVLGRDA